MPSEMSIGVILLYGLICLGLGVWIGWGRGKSKNESLCAECERVHNKMIEGVRKRRS